MQWVLYSCIRTRAKKGFGRYWPREEERRLGQSLQESAGGSQREEKERKKKEELQR
jgi:hypothetical protein